MEWHTRKLNATHLHYMGLKKTGQGLFLGGAHHARFRRRVAPTLLISEQSGRWCILRREETECWRNAVINETRLSAGPHGFPNGVNRRANPAVEHTSIGCPVPYWLS